jgi:hypothetical protein
VTIVLWIIVGALLGLLSRIAMPIENDGGDARYTGVGVAVAVISGAIAAIGSDRSILLVNPLSIAWAANGALYILFGYRCLAMRGK